MGIKRDFNKAEKLEEREAKWLKGKSSYINTLRDAIKNRDNKEAKKSIKRLRRYQGVLEWYHIRVLRGIVALEEDFPHFYFKKSIERYRNAIHGFYRNLEKRFKKDDGSIVKFLEKLDSYIYDEQWRQLSNEINIIEKSINEWIKLDRKLIEFEKKLYEQKSKITTAVFDEINKIKSKSTSPADRKKSLADLNSYFKRYGNVYSKKERNIIIKSFRKFVIAGFLTLTLATSILGNIAYGAAPFREFKKELDETSSHEGAEVRIFKKNTGQNIPPIVNKILTSGITTKSRQILKNIINNESNPIGNPGTKFNFDVNYEIAEKRMNLIFNVAIINLAEDLGNNVFNEIKEGNSNPQKIIQSLFNSVIKSRLYDTPPTKQGTRVGDHMSSDGNDDDKAPNLSIALANNKLDCDTASLILCAIGKSLGFYTFLIPYETHAICRWTNGRQNFYIEATTGELLDSKSVYKEYPKIYGPIMLDGNIVGISIDDKDKLKAYSLFTTGLHIASKKMDIKRKVFLVRSALIKAYSLWPQKLIQEHIKSTDNMFGDFIYDEKYRKINGYKPLPK